MKPVAAALAGALISGVVMYTVGARTEQVDAFAQPEPVHYVQTVDGQFIPVTPAAQPVGFNNSLQPAAPNALQPIAAAPAPAVVERPVVVERPAAQRTVYRTAPVQERVVVEREPAQPKRSWTKTALIIGGSSAAGAGTGGLIGGKKGALIGAAVGGGAATIYEATRRR